MTRRCGINHHATLNRRREQNEKMLTLKRMDRHKEMKPGLTDPKTATNFGGFMTVAGYGLMVLWTVRGGVSWRSPRTDAPCCYYYKRTSYQFLNPPHQRTTWPRAPPNSSCTSGTCTARAPTFRAPPPSSRSPRTRTTRRSRRCCCHR